MRSRKRVYCVDEWDHRDECMRCSDSEVRIVNQNPHLYCKTKHNLCMGVSWQCKKIPSVKERFTIGNIVGSVKDDSNNPNEGGHMAYEVGQKVTVDGEKGFTIVKVMKSSAKVESPQGKVSIKPFAFIEAEGKAPAKKKAAAPSRKRTAEPEKKSSSRKRTKAYVAPDDDDDDTESVADEVSSAPAKKRDTVDDGVTAALAKADTPTKMIDLVKKHKAYKHINTEAFKRVVGQKNDLGMGLIRMRLGNLLRGAINRSKK